MILPRPLRNAIALFLLAAFATATSPASAADAREDGHALGQSLGLFVASAGVAAFAAGVVLGRERARRDDATARCSVDVCHSMASLMFEDAQSQSTSAFRLMSVGALAMASGVALYLAAPSRNASGALGNARVALGAGGITFAVAF